MSKMKEYAWEINREEEFWDKEGFSTIKECIADAVQGYGVKKGDKIYIGECVTFAVLVDAESVLDALEEDAYDECGECAENWETRTRDGSKEVLELSDTLTEAVNAWLKKHNREPRFFNIENIKEYTV